MELMKILFSGFGGALLAAIVSYLIYRKSNKSPMGKAYELLKSLGKMLREPEGEFLTSESAKTNFDIANRIFQNADGDVIATSFNEDPAHYDIDMAKSFRYGSRFTRITSSDVCEPLSQNKTKERMNADLHGSRLILAPQGEGFTRIDGIFCRFDDNTYLCFMALRNAENPNLNHGLVFRDGIAKNFFDYYESLAQRGRECN